MRNKVVILDDDDYQAICEYLHNAYAQTKKLDESYNKSEISRYISSAFKLLIDSPSI